MLPSEHQEVIQTKNDLNVDIMNFLWINMQVEFLGSISDFSV